MRRVLVWSCVAAGATVLGPVALAQSLAQRLLTRTGSDYTASQADAVALPDVEFTDLEHELESQAANHADWILVPAIRMRHAHPQVAVAFDRMIADALAHPDRRSITGLPRYDLHLPPGWFDWDALACEFMLKRDDVPVEARWEFIDGFGVRGRERPQTCRLLVPLACASRAPARVLSAAVGSARVTHDDSFPGFIEDCYIRERQSGFRSNAIEFNRFARNFSGPAALEAARHMQEFERELQRQGAATLRRGPHGELLPSEPGAPDRSVPESELKERTRRIADNTASLREVGDTVDRTVQILEERLAKK